jgi:hypothetical protein
MYGWITALAKKFLGVLKSKSVTEQGRVFVMNWIVIARGSGGLG